MTEQLIITGTITATSSKDTGKFDPKAPKITAYLDVPSDVDKKALQQAGLQLYSSKDGENFFIVKLGNEINVYDEVDNQLMFALDGNLETGKLFKMEKPGKIAIFETENRGNKVFRITDILTSAENIVKIERQNPFI